MAEKRITPNLDFRGTYPAPGRIGHTPERVKQNDLDPVKFNEYERVLMEIAEFIGDLDLEFVHDYIAPAQQRPDNIGDAFRTIWSALNGAKYDKSGGLIAGDLDVGGTTHLLGVLSVDDDVVLQKDIDIYGISRFHDTADFRSITMLWKTGINYRKDEIVRYADGLYMCTESHLSGSAFEYDSDYWVSIGGGGAGGSGATVIRTQQFITQSGEFDVLLWAAPPGKNYTNITIGGVPQRKATYELSGRRVYFSGIPAGIPGEIQYYQVCSAGMAADILSEQHIPSGEQSTFRLRDYPLSKDHLFLHTNGHLYRSNEFSLDGRDITLNEPLASGEILEIRSVRAMAVLEVEDGTLTTPKYQDLSITSPKLAADIEISNLTAISSFVSEETARAKALSIPWAPNTPYVQGDIVVHLGTIYECQTGHQSTTSIVADMVYWNEIGGGGGGSSGVTKTILQDGHGFTKGQALRFNGAYGLAVADSWDNLAVCLVSEILDDNNFITTTAGYITGLSGLLPGAMHYLSPTIPGGLTPVRPSGIMQSMLFAITDSEGYVSMGAPSLVGQSIFRSQEFVIDDDVCVVDLNGQPPNGDYTFVHVGGVPQRPSDYRVVGKQIILSGYPVGISGEIRYVEVQNVGPGADVLVDSYVTTSGQMVFPVNVPIADNDRRFVDLRIGGIAQHQSSFLISGNAVVTAEALPVGLPVEIRTIRRLPIAEPALGSVYAQHIVSGEINSTHLSSGCIHYDHFSSDTQNKLFADTRTNHIINGNMCISQRGVTFTSPAHNAYTLDRWKWMYSGSMLHTITQVNDMMDSVGDRTLKAECTSADSSMTTTDYCAVGQNIEGYNFQPLRGKTATLSFWVKATKTGTYCVGFCNSGWDKVYIAEYIVNESNTWEEKSITLTFDYSGGTWLYGSDVGLRVWFTLCAGPDRYISPNSWHDVSAPIPFATSNQVNNCNDIGDLFYLARVQLVEGSVAPPFKPRLYGDELSLCQRYYEKGDAASFFSGNVTSGNAYHHSVHYAVKKRAIISPVIIEGGDVNFAAGAPTVHGYVDDGFSVRKTADGTGVGNYYYDWYCDAEL